MPVEKAQGRLGLGSGGLPRRAGALQQRDAIGQQSRAGQQGPGLQRSGQAQAQQQGRPAQAQAQGTQLNS